MKHILSVFALSLLLINCDSDNTASEGTEFENQIDSTNEVVSTIEPGIRQYSDESPVIFNSSVIDSINFPIFVMSSENPNSRVLQCYLDEQLDFVGNSPEIHFEISDYLDLKVDKEYLIPNDKMILKVTEMGILSNFWVVDSLTGSVIFKEIQDSLMTVQFDLTGKWTNSHEPESFEFSKEVTFDNYHSPE